MQKIDAHQHFWKYNAARDRWITDDMAVLQKDFLPKDLQPILQQNGFDGCVAVQADQSEEETHFLLSLSQEYNFIKGVVGWVDVQKDNIDERLFYFKQFPLIKGFRHILQGEADRALMLSLPFKRGIDALHRYQFTYDILIFPDQLQYAKELAEIFPHQKFVIDHLAKPNIKDKKMDDWKKDMAAIAEFENVYCKISGMVTEADWKQWTKEDFTPYLDAVVKAFGTSRIMYGSDWPVCLAAASYQQQLSVIQAYFSTFSKPEQDKIFGGNAIQFYNL